MKSKILGVAAIVLLLAFAAVPFSSAKIYPKHIKAEQMKVRSHVVKETKIPKTTVGSSSDEGNNPRTNTSGGGSGGSEGSDGQVCYGDMNYDGQINNYDLRLFLLVYGLTQEQSMSMFWDYFASRGDFNQDGVIDLTDLSNILAILDTQCQQP